MAANACRIGSIFGPLRSDLLRRSSLLNRNKLITNIRCLATAQELKYEGIKVETTKSPLQKPDPDTLVFGRLFTDHMLEISWDAETGWGTPEISPFHNLSLPPAASALHYAIECFEGMKALRGDDGKVRLFRPMENMRRLNNSAERISLPTFDEEELFKCLKHLVSLDQEWVPYSNKCSLYIRPTFIGTEPSLGVSKSSKALLYVIMSPVGPYFKTGTFNPVALLADPALVRAWPGGSGDSKLGGNYGPTILPQAKAERMGLQQVLWLFGEDHQVTEVGTMNIFMFWINEKGEKELITPPLSGVILPGVTRKSLLELGRQWGEFKVSERKFTMGDVVKAVEEERVKEIFGAGTACVVCPVNRISYGGKDFMIPTMENGAEITKRFYEELTGIQYGRIPSKWTVEVE